MAYKTEELFEQAKKSAIGNNLIFIEEIVSFLPCHKSTFYEHFPENSDQYNELRRIIDDNKVSMKAKMRSKWYESDNATLQLALYRLTSSNDEHKKLNQNYTDITSKNEKIDNKFEIEILTNQNEVSPEETN
jgi:hypothetical protein